MKSSLSSSTAVQSQPESAAAQEAPAPLLTSGFGSLIEEEHALETYLGECIHTIGGQHGDSVDRIFVNHLQQIREILALLYKRSEMLPNPARFRTLKLGARIFTRSPHQIIPPVQPVLHRLVSLHLHLQRGIEVLLKKDHDAKCDETMLSQVAQKHDEMGWMLTALLKEDGRGQDPEFSAILGSNPPTLFEERAEKKWENEGGPADPRA